MNLREKNSFRSSLRFLFAPIQRHVQTPRFNRTSLTYYLLLLAALTAGCSPSELCSLPMESPGRLKTSEVSEGFKKYDDIFSGEKPVLYCEGKRHERVGHVLGAYQEYPMKATRRGIKTRKYNHLAGNAVGMMKNAFDNLDLDAVELDVHVNTQKHEDENLYILHYEPDWDTLKQSQDSVKFLSDERNTFRGLLREFFPTYSAQGKRLYVELKAPADCRMNGGPSTPLCKLIAKKLASDLEKHRNYIQSGNRPIAFISFSTQLLDTVHDNLPKELRSNIDFILILSPSSRFKAWIASRRGWVPTFGEAAKHWMTDRAWLTGVWYSPRATNGFPDLISEINLARVSSGHRRLSVGVSAYLQGSNNFIKGMRANWSHPRKIDAPALVQTIIYDIDSR